MDSIGGLVSQVTSKESYVSRPDQYQYHILLLDGRDTLWPLLDSPVVGRLMMGSVFSPLFRDIRAASRVDGAPRLSNEVVGHRATRVCSVLVGATEIDPVLLSGAATRAGSGARDGPRIVRKMDDEGLRFSLFTRGVSLASDGKHERVTSRRLEQ